jgi:hypothetical protein
MATDQIVRAAIHPSIGVARVGNSEHAYIFAPEVVDPLPDPPGSYRDETGALKRQAVRFRVYGLSADGGVVAELTAANSSINWTVHLANKKAAWYQFQLALDVPEAASAPPSLLRNMSIGDRAALTIDPGPRHVSGRNAGGGPGHTFDTGRFMGKPVYLGEVRTDDDGRLVVLGGRGVSAAHDGGQAITFANNDGWHDDVSDGPVTAEVVFEGRQLAVDPAWVVVAPPNYGPRQKAVRTLWDLMRDLAISAGTLTAPARPSFDRDIRPIFERLSRLQWVNAGFAAAFGWRAPNNLSTSEWLARLGQNSRDDWELRRTIANQFRMFDRDAWSPVPWPWLYGDAMSVPTPPTPRAFTALTGTQLKMLQQWSTGDFDSDYDPARPSWRILADVPLAEQPDMLDRASLEFCLADAFHPGCEMTWPVRQPTLYMAPFRFLHAPAGWHEPGYGPQMSPDMLGPFDPFLGQVPGGITRWMAVPWQTDTASCRAGYTPAYDPFLPTFWPARVPNNVLTEEDYATVMDAERPVGERLAAFARRASWTRQLGRGSYVDQINGLVQNISQMGVVEERPGIPNDPLFPPVMEVESLPPATSPHRAAFALTAGQDDEVDLSGIAKVRRFPHGLKQFT